MLEIYTDGSCNPNPGPGGWSFVVYENHKEIHHAYGGERNTTNNRMEFMGILEALKWLQGREAVIKTDSQYCLNCITKWAGKWRSKGWRLADGSPVKNAELLQDCLTLKTHLTHFKWVKGHSKIKGNERADKLAGMGRASLMAAPVDLTAIDWTKPISTKRLDALARKMRIKPATI